ncbi:MAG: hypothetical protein ACQEWW_07940 [Bacillota bacterium]|jgi:hypothetical protein
MREILYFFIIKEKAQEAKKFYPIRLLKKIGTFPKSSPYIEW